MTPVTTATATALASRRPAMPRRAAPFISGWKLARQAEGLEAERGGRGEDRLVGPRGDEQEVAGDGRARVHARARASRPEEPAVGGRERVDAALVRRGEDDVVRDGRAAEDGLREQTLPERAAGRDVERDHPARPLRVVDRRERSWLRSRARQREAEVDD